MAPSYFDDQLLAECEFDLERASGELLAVEKMLRTAFVAVRGQRVNGAREATDGVIVYRDSFADEIRAARRSPDRQPEVVRIRFRGFGGDVILATCWVANAVAAGCLGNAAWETLKATTISFRNRKVEAGQPKPLTIEEARSIARIALGVAGVLNGAVATGSQSRIDAVRWDFVFEHAGRRWQVSGDHADPLMARVSIREVTDASPSIPGRQVSDDRTTSGRAHGEGAAKLDRWAWAKKRHRAGRHRQG